MRILHVVEATTAGVRRHVYTLASAIDQRRWSGVVACPPVREQAFGDAAFADELAAAGIPVIVVPMVRAIRPAADTKALWHLIRLARSGHFDLIHCHSSKAGFLGRVAARVAGVPSIYTPHGLYVLSMPASPKRRFFLLLEQFAGLLGDRVIAVSVSERDVIVRAGIAPIWRVVCIENAIDLPRRATDAERTATRHMLDIGDATPLIGTAARLSAQKNPRRFLEGAAALLRNQPAARFVWCGSGDLENAAQQSANELGIAHAVRFLGHREDARDILAALDVFWLTSNYEGLSAALLEAMALGVPVVATDVVGNRDALRGTAGMLVPPENPAGFARATMLLLERPDWRAAFTRNAQALVRERWSAARMAHETEQLYETVLAERAGAATRRPTALHATNTIVASYDQSGRAL